MKYTILWIFLILFILYDAKGGSRGGGGRGGGGGGGRGRGGSRGRGFGSYSHSNNGLFGGLFSLFGSSEETIIVDYKPSILPKKKPIFIPSRWRKKDKGVRPYEKFQGDYAGKIQEGVFTTFKLLGTQDLRVLLNESMDYLSYGSGHSDWDKGKNLEKSSEETMESVFGEDSFLGIKQFRKNLQLSMDFSLLFSKKIHQNLSSDEEREFAQKKYKFDTLMQNLTEIRERSWHRLSSF